MRRPAATWVVVIALGVLAVLVLVVTPTEGAPPFDPGSSQPDGYRAVALLLQETGAEVRSGSIGQSGGDAESFIPGATSGDAFVVPVAEYLDDRTRMMLREAASSGSTVVLSGVEGFSMIDGASLTRTPARPVARGSCDIGELASLEAVDDIGGMRLRRPAGSRGCFGDATESLVTSSAVGDGTLVELASPYLWANARLQPDKEDGGRALDNGPMATALLGGAATVTFLAVEPPEGFLADGTRSPLELLPLPVELALLQAAGAFLVFLLWRSRRLGRPVSEEVPVEIAGSELVEAVGGLLRRRGSPAGAA